MIAVPKKHCISLLDCNADVLNALMLTIKRVSNHITDTCDYSGVNLLNASGDSAGQSVAHFHIHIIPRKNDDNIDAWPAMSNHKYSLEEMQKKLKMR